MDTAEDPALARLRYLLPYAKQVKAGVPRPVVETKLSVMGLAADGLTACLQALEAGKFELREGVGMEPTAVWDSIVGPRQTMRSRVVSSDPATAPLPAPSSEGGIWGTPE